MPAGIAARFFARLSPTKTHREIDSKRDKTRERENKRDREGYSRGMWVLDTFDGYRLWCSRVWYASDKVRANVYTHEARRSQKEQTNCATRTYVY